ncbi:hypothetical protein EZJ49_10475 [Bdellovibrio bacteriovorus]|uniref:hypothetical protein n=1 Tax=Bdellovibrio bacteriovorus TaxID=959 RepID=UPI0021CE7A4F|nr:hypothetical protein [Bdellovibrio bacteriovorus]UXR63499.1 hypothetical protein EZJ49_10475 [Bdellovibrio bacteriovorus]
MKLLGTIFFVSTLWTLNASAQDQTAVCQETVERRGSIQMQMIPASDGNCFVSVHNRKAQGLLYRDYLFTADGELMIFNSFGPGDESQTTGAREFFMFPRVQSTPTYEWNDETRRLTVTTVNGNRASFDYEDAELVEMTGATIKRASSIVPGNRGGIEILNYQGLLLDGGFKMGSAPTGNSRANSIFTDRTGKTCKVQNYELFKYTSDGDVIFKHSDKGLQSLLKSRCPQLNF